MQEIFLFEKLGVTEDGKVPDESASAISTPKWRLFDDFPTNTSSKFRVEGASLRPGTAGVRP